MSYVAHDCRNSRLKPSHKDYCNNMWIDKDLTNIKTFPPDWKYCRECCKKLGIDFDAQTTTSNLTEKELKERERLKKISKKAFLRRMALKNINSGTLAKGGY